MKYLLRFRMNGKQYFLHNGNCFIGGSTYAIAEVRALENSAKSISVGGFDIVAYTDEEILKLIGGVPYRILGFGGGLVPFEGVEIKCSLEIKE